MQKKYKLFIGIFFGTSIFLYFVFLQYINIVNVNKSNEIKKDIKQIEKQRDVLNKKIDELQLTKTSSTQELDSLKLDLEKLKSDIEIAVSKFGSLN